MTKRKPPGVRWESWIDRQIREAQDRGDFDELPGAGKPIPDLDKPYDENWWVRGKLSSEGLSYLPPPLAMKKKAHDALTAAMDAESEAEAQEIIQGINAEIREALRRGIIGSSIVLVPYDIDRVVRDWRAQHPR